MTLSSVTTVDGSMSPATSAKSPGRLYADLPRFVPALGGRPLQQLEIGLRRIHRGRPRCPAPGELMLQHADAAANVEMGEAV